jgi:hypothetical protein
MEAVEAHQVVFQRVHRHQVATGQAQALFHELWRHLLHPAQLELAHPGLHQPDPHHTIADFLGRQQGPGGGHVPGIV